MKNHSMATVIIILLTLGVVLFAGCINQETPKAGGSVVITGPAQNPVPVIEGTIKSAGDLILTQADFGQDYKVRSRVDNPDVLVNLTSHFPADWNQSKQDEYNILLQKKLEETKNYKKNGLIDFSTVYWTRTDSGGNNTGYGNTEAFVFTNTTNAALFFEKQSSDRCEMTPPNCFRSIQGLGDQALEWTGNGIVNAQYIVRINNAVVTASADHQAEALVAAEKIVVKARNAQSEQIQTPVTFEKPLLPPPSPTAIITTSDHDACSPVTITQTDGTQVTLPCQPHRIIVANANAAEMLIAIGAGDRIVGVTDSTQNVTYVMDKLPSVESIGNWQIPNIERILSLHPDVVIAYSSYKPKNLDQLTAVNITVISLDYYKLNQLPSDAREMGKLTGKTVEAEGYAQMVENATDLVAQRVHTIPPEQYPSTYFESYMDYTAASRGSGSDDMLKASGGKNIAGDTPSSSIKVSPEWVVSQKPEFVMKVVSSSETRSLAEIVQILNNRNGWDNIPAVQQTKVYAISNDVEYGPRAYIGLVYMAKILHPDVFRDIDPRKMLDEYARKYVAGADIETPVYPEPK
jgi:iron complex transport system substrate-binding protein